MANVANLNLTSGTININMLGGSLTSGNYDVINYSGSLSGIASALTLTGVASGNTRQVFTLATSGSSAGELRSRLSTVPPRI